MLLILMNCLPLYVQPEANIANIYKSVTGTEDVKIWSKLLMLVLNML